MATWKDYRHLAYGYRPRGQKGWRIEIPGGTIYIETLEPGAIRVSVESYGTRFADTHSYMEPWTEKDESAGSFTVRVHHRGSCPDCGGKEEV